MSNGISHSKTLQRFGLEYIQAEKNTLQGLDQNKDGNTTPEELFKFSTSSCIDEFGNDSEALAKSLNISMREFEMYKKFAGDDGILDEFEYTEACNSKENFELMDEVTQLREKIENNPLNKNTETTEETSDIENPKNEKTKECKEMEKAIAEREAAEKEFTDKCQISDVNIEELRKLKDPKAENFAAEHELISKAYERTLEHKRDTADDIKSMAREFKNLAADMDCLVMKEETEKLKANANDGAKNEPSNPFENKENGMQNPFQQEQEEDVQSLTI